MENVYPQPLKNRTELDFRYGIKSSMPEIKQLVGLVIAIYLTKKESIVNYGEPNGRQIKLDDHFIKLLVDFFNSELISTSTTVNQFIEIVNRNPLLTSQMEPLQVALELYLKLCKISFPDGSSNSKEREKDGGIIVRYPKQIRFTTNIEIINLCFEAQELSAILFNWIMNFSESKENDGSLDKLKKILTIFSEETQFKIRTTSDETIYFQQEGIYSQVLKGDAVNSRDANGGVGPFRILKRFIEIGLHPYLKLQTGTKEFVINNSISVLSLSNYKELVSSYLDVIPKRTTIVADIPDNVPKYEEPVKSIISYNKIIFGAPGTGKSSKIKDAYATGHEQRRVTFHPDYEYASFVGSYKPKTDANGNIRYEYVPQEFIKIYTDAWNDPDKWYFLIIEEINRGNCAQIFGDLFQSLDRDAFGFSEYVVDTDTDLANYLETFFLKNLVAAERLGEQLQKRKYPSTAYSKIIIPNNLYLYATMNTSDQSLFPMDSAFKRRWDWEYIPIDVEPKTSEGEIIELKIILDNGNIYSWANFVKSVNKLIYKATLSEDKQLGFWFIKPNADRVIKEDEFKSKVLFYLWFDVFRSEPEYSIFPEEIERGESEKENFGYGHLFDSAVKDGILSHLMKELNISPQ